MESIIYIVLYHIFELMKFYLSAICLIVSWFSFCFSQQSGYMMANTIDPSDPYIVSLSKFVWKQDYGSIEKATTEQISKWNSLLISYFYRATARMYMQDYKNAQKDANFLLSNYSWYVDSSLINSQIYAAQNFKDNPILELKKLNDSSTKWTAEKYEKAWDLYYNIADSLRNVTTSGYSYYDYQNWVVSLIYLVRSSDAYAAALVLNPKSSSLYVKLAKSLFPQKKNMSGIRKLLQKALVLDKKNAQWRERLWSTYTINGTWQLTQAIKYYDQAIILDENLTQTRLLRADAYDQLWKTYEAYQNYQKFLEKVPNSVIWLNNMWLLLLKLNNYEEAMWYFKKAIDLNSYVFEWYQNLALCYALAGEKELAYKYLNIGIQNVGKNHPKIKEIKAFIDKSFSKINN